MFAIYISIELRILDNLVTYVHLYLKHHETYLYFIIHNGRVT